MELFAVRHGETISNIEKKFTGRSVDSPLSEKGIEQAKKLGKSLENITFDAVYSSPLSRAVDTANIALGNNYNISIDDRLAEISLGVMEGMTFEDGSAKYPESGKLFLTDPASYKPPQDGESLNDIIERVSSFLDDLAKMKHDKVFLSTHGYALRVLYACAIDKSISAIAEAPFYANCDIEHYVLNDGKWELSRSTHPSQSIVPKEFRV